MAFIFGWLGGLLFLVEAAIDETGALRFHVLHREEAGGAGLGGARRDWHSFGVSSCLGLQREHLLLFTKTGWVQGHRITILILIQILEY